MYVNNEYDLKICQREIQIMRELAGHKNIIKYIDSSVRNLKNNVHEVLILTQYYKSGHVLMKMNQLLKEGTSFSQVFIKFFVFLESVYDIVKLNLFRWND